MNKYQEALEKIKRNITEALSLLVYGKATKALFVEIETNTYDYVNILQELVDRADERMTHILRVRKEGYPTRIAFHSSNEAHDFAVKHDLKGCTLDSIQFAEYEHYDKLLETLKSA